MSAQLFSDDVMFLQRFLRSCGLYQGNVHGSWDPPTDVALSSFDERCQEIASRHGRFDARSEGYIATLHPRAQEQARAFLSRVRAAGIDARILSGTRTYAEQEALYRKGRWGNPGPVVTKARGGHSNHNFGIAWDIGIFEGRKYLDRSPLYDRAAEVGLSPEIEWGGHWRSFPDRPHYQLATGLPIARVRESFEAGTAFV
jgi:peptidoglycan L-alanyl-D-glutamate endopeptidase CwlK